MTSTRSHLQCKSFAACISDMVAWLHACTSAIGQGMGRTAAALALPGYGAAVWQAVLVNGD